MAKRPDDSGEIMVPPKPGSAAPPPPRQAGKKPRPFPVRLWAWALLMTAGTGAGGYFAWNYRGDKIHAEDALGTVTTERDGFKAAAEIDHKQLGECQASVTALSGKAKDTETQLTQTTSAAADCKAALQAAQAAKEESDKRIAALANFQKKFSDMVGTGKIKVSGRRGNLVLELPSEVLFPSGQAELSETGELNVLQVGLILKEFPDRRYLVVGHTDAAPLSGSIYKDNWELSTARALTVTRFLVKAGMKASNLIPAGEGEHDPVADNATGSGRARNRRIEIILLPAITELPALPAGLGDAADPPKKTK
ncbi:MAG: OmpA family protein [Deltaproteobacteria bacterium]|nr:OmpA family protein [Deltaproteobacteria bacterium]